ncbi:MAG TPA: hypothetical protein PKX99_09110, partial [Thermoanaerobaculia bacterium]|nr:hypothetical protein [Thermoanaerobaculia bacterium]
MCPPEEQTEPVLSSHWRSIAGRQGTILPPHGPDLDAALATPPLSAIAWQRTADAAAGPLALALLALGGATPASAAARIAAAAAALTAEGRLVLLLPPDATTATADRIRLALHEAGCVLLDT